MSDHDLLIHGTFPDGSRGSLAISGGKIIAAGPSVTGTAADEIDFGPDIILPGWIDAHVHFNEPGRGDWEGLATGSRALAAGGGTTFCDMPLNSNPPVITRGAFDEKRRLAEHLSCLDFALWGGLTPDSLKHMPAMAEAGAMGFKAFMCPSGIDEFGDANPSILRQGMKIAAGLGLPVGVHAEDPDYLAAYQKTHPPSGKDMRAWLDSRPVGGELSAIKIAIDIAGETGCKLHIVHVTCAEGIRMVSAAKALGVDVTVETCPHYLLLDDIAAINTGPAAKCAPPIRSAATVAELWQELLDGNIDTIGSDHSPSPMELKQGDDIFAMWGGIAGIQHGLPLLLDKSLGLAPQLSARVAERFHLPEKGHLAPGYDADFMIVQKRPFTITRESLLTRHAISPYIGMTSSIAITGTYLRGKAVTAETRGKFIAPAFA